MKNLGKLLFYFYKIKTVGGGKVLLAPPPPKTLLRNYIPYLGQIRAKLLYILFKKERTHAIPCPAAHPCISHIRGYPSGGALKQWFCPIVLNREPYIDIKYMKIRITKLSRS